MCRSRYYMDFCFFYFHFDFKLGFSKFPNISKFPLFDRNWYVLTSRNIDIFNKTSDRLLSNFHRRCEIGVEEVVRKRRRCAPLFLRYSAYETEGAFFQGQKTVKHANVRVDERLLKLIDFANTDTLDFKRTI